jgi:hypothetical protein
MVFLLVSFCAAGAVSLFGLGEYAEFLELRPRLRQREA